MNEAIGEDGGWSNSWWTVQNVMTVDDATGDDGDWTSVEDGNRRYGTDQMNNSVEDINCFIDLHKQNWIQKISKIYCISSNLPR